MRVDFPKKSNVLVQKKKCGISNDVFSSGSGTAEIQVTVYCAKLWNFKSRLFCESRTAELRDIVYSLCGGGTAGLKVKALVWKRNCETSSRTKFIVWKRNCLTSKPQYFPCAEAELRHFRALGHTLFCIRKWNCGTLSLSIFLVRRRNFKPKNILCVEAERQNFKSHNSLYVESLWFLMQ